MRSLVAVFLFWLWTSFALANEVPGILVVPSGDKGEIVDAARKGLGKVDGANLPGTQAFDRAKFENSLVPLSLVEVTSSELDQDGRLTPISWLLTDPIFRAAVEDRVIPTPSNYPPLSEALSAMPRLKVGYVLMVGAFTSEGQVWTHAQLYKGQKEIWRDQVRTWSIQTQSEFDSDNAKRSIARTWVQVLSTGPLKDIPQRKRAATPDPVQGTGFQNDTAAPPVPQDNKQLLADVAKLMNSGHVAEAILMLRDAVDDSPADMERRQALIDALLRTGEHSLAAREARRAAQMTPEKVHLWLTAARAWIAAGNENEAVSDLNEAVSRDPEGAETRLLLAEMQLVQLRFPLALDHLNQAIKQQGSSYGLALRALAHAVQGMEAEMAADLEAASKSTPAETPSQAARRSEIALRIGIETGNEAGTQIRSLIQRVRLSSGSDENRADAAQLSARIRGMSTYFASLGAHPKHGKSMEMLVLALKLLAQSVADLSGSFGQLDEDALTEAAINLGEGIKALGLAKTEHAKEIA